MRCLPLAAGGSSPFFRFYLPRETPRSILRLRIEVVGVDTPTLEVFLEPVDDVPEAFDAVRGFPGARKLVGLAGKSDHGGRLFPDLERAEHRLASLRRRGAQVLVPLDEEHGCRDPVRVSHGRAGQEL